MSKLKTSTELSQERAIISRYTPRSNKDDFSDGEYYDHSYIPDFLEDFKIPGDNKKMKDENNILIDCNNIFGKDLPKEDISDVYMQEPTYGTNIFGEVCWNGDVSLYNGVNRAGRSIVLGLCDKNISVKIREQNDNIKHINKTTNNFFDMMKKMDLNNPVNIYHATIPNDFEFNSIFYSYFNNENEITEHVLSSLKCFSEIWVPSRFNKDMLIKNNIEKVHTIPLGIDLKRYNKNPKLTKFSIETNKFSFLSILNNDETLEMQILFKAYLEEFNDNDDVSLVIISKLPFENIERNFLLVRQTVNKNDDELPHIVPYNNLVCEKDMPTCYYKSNVVLSLSRKAFGFSCLEAGSICKPIISINDGGQMDFLNNKNCFLINKDNLLDETKLKMRYVKNNYFEAITKAETLNKEIKNNYDINHTISIIHEKLESIKNRRDKK